MGLAHAVLTMVARDDLPDGGMAHVARCVEAIRDRCPTARIETLISDAKGDAESLALLFEVRPDVLNHNIETVARLQRAVRPSAGYARSLSVLARAKAAGLTTKSGLIVGMGNPSRDRASPIWRVLGSTSSPSPVPASDDPSPAGGTLGRASPSSTSGT
jgi:lipoic acid synthetase